ncbi:hypothetical protein IHE45_19G037600 [Dioscorea alata]|uniref:Uncharacterized protein n=1 Tax=Dioscorea alata TaxID=55571 RepID=A0ACB7TXH7_DIOAL|nr:hypothetical protein IHE45_19G037600 [Dioscorea alata]
MSHSIHYQLNILNLKNLDSLHHLHEQLFIRCYIPIASNKRFRIETQQLPFHTSIDIKSNSKSIKDLLKKHNIIFELRLRNPKSMFKFVSKSKLLGKAEISWMDILHANEKSMEKCISFIMFHWLSIDIKPPSLMVKMEALVTGETRKMINGGHECDCEACHWIGCEEDVFLAATAALL